VVFLGEEISPFTFLVRIYAIDTYLQRGLKTS